GVEFRRVLFRSCRARRLADGGARALFAELHPGVRWRAGGRLTVEIVYDAPLTLAGHGLALGLATVWEASSPPVADALARVLGRTRAQLLATLETPHTGTALAQALGVTA